ncbi:MAG: M20/M25/M40 family metallo-hydrolase [Candidatus Geothermincolia bacterium]
MADPRERLLSTFLELVSIASETYHEKAVSRYVQKYCATLGIATRTDDAGAALDSETGNLYFEVPARGLEAPPILLSAHLDTVTPGKGVVPVVEDGVIRASGDTVLGADCKAGVAAILELLSRAAEGSFRHGPLQVLLTVAEEAGLQGVRHADRSKLAVKWALVLDGSGEVGKAVVASPTQDNLTFYVKGKAAHAGVEPEKGINAIQAAARAIAALELGRIDEETTANVGIIGGGLAVNIVPEETWFKGEVRSHDDSKLDETRMAFIKTVRDACADAGAQVEFEVERAYDGYALPESDPLLALAAAAAKDAGVPFSSGPTGGGSDANVLRSFGMTPLVLNMGARLPHTLEEHIELEEMERLVRYTAAILERAGQLPLTPSA